MAAIEAIVSSGVQTLGDDTMDTVTFNRDCNEIEVWASGPVSFTVDGTDPEVGAPECHHLPAAGTRDKIGVPSSGNTVVKLIADNGCDYLVTRSS